MATETTPLAQDAGKYFGLRVDIRVGDDVFRGGAGRDHVRYSPAYDEDAVPAGDDDMDTGAGNDKVEIYSLGGFPGSVALGDGHDSLYAPGIRFGPDTMLAGGDSYDELTLTVHSDDRLPSNITVNAEGDGLR